MACYGTVGSYFIKTGWVDPFTGIFTKSCAFDAIFPAKLAMVFANLGLIADVVVSDEFVYGIPVFPVLRGRYYE